MCIRDRVRLLLRPRDGGSELTCAALVNTGFTSDTPDLAVPPSLAERLGHWPPREALLVQLETGGGLAEGYLVPQAVAVRVATDDRCSREVVANLLVDPHIGEALISDCLAEELGIQVLYPRRGLWKFADEDRVRESVGPTSAPAGSGPPPAVPALN